jgi:chromate reductase
MAGSGQEGWRIVTLCGSLRARSSNRSLLQAYAHLVPAGVGVRFEHYDRLAELPHFNPDLDGDDQSVPAEVARLREKVTGAHAIVISTPEYAHALPGSFKNALDWLVSEPAFAGKPVVILHAARGSTWALDSLREVLATMSARIVDAACVTLPLGSNRLDEAAMLAREDIHQPLAASMDALLRELSEVEPPPVSSAAS